MLFSLRFLGREFLDFQVERGRDAPPRSLVTSLGGSFERADEECDCGECGEELEPDDKFGFR